MYCSLSLDVATGSCESSYNFTVGVKLGGAYKFHIQVENILSMVLVIKNNKKQV